MCIRDSRQTDRDRDRERHRERPRTNRAMSINKNKPEDDRVKEELVVRKELLSSLCLTDHYATAHPASTVGKTPVPLLGFPAGPGST